MYDREPLYVISVAARLLGMHAQTLRKYERERFIIPSRTSGRLRLYSAEDIERLRQIQYLVDDLELNLAGVRLALTLSERLRKLRQTLRNARGSDGVAERCERELHELLVLLGVPEDAREADERAGQAEHGADTDSREGETARGARTRSRY